MTQRPVDFDVGSPLFQCVRGMGRAFVSSLGSNRFLEEITIAAQLDHPTPCHARIGMPKHVELAEQHLASGRSPNHLTARNSMTVQARHNQVLGLPDQFASLAGLGGGRSVS